jgi:hypothetical protein
MALITDKSNKVRQEEFDVIARKKNVARLTISDLIIPIASGIVFIILTFAVFVPMVKSAIDYLGQIKEVEGKIEQLEKLDKQLTKLDETQANQDVVTSRVVIPKKLLVSDLVYYLDTLATSLNLEISELSSSDTLNAVSGPLGYRGSYDSVLSFLDQAQNVSPYMLRLENAEVSRRGKKESGEIWDISLNVSGYFISEDTKEPDIYSNFQPYTEYNDIVEIFRVKAASKNQ